MLISTALYELERIVKSDPSIIPEESIDQLSPWQRRLLSLFAPSLAGVDLEPHAALPHLVNELNRLGGFSTLIFRLAPLIQQETQLVKMAEAMAEGAHLQLDAEPPNLGTSISTEIRVELA